jgi:pimeloyl-ACP methyl ester carboxylesterase
METMTESPRQVHTSRESGSIVVSGETVRYEILVMDARTDDERAPGAGLAGNVIVVVPGHGQTVTGPRRLVAEFAMLSRSKIAWCIDPTPTRGGDCTEARAIAEVVHDRLFGLKHTSARSTHRATIVGWSHGGGEALRAAREDPALFPQYLGLCPVGLVERKPPEMVASFLLEATRVVAGDLFHARLANVAETLRVGGNFVRGLVIDLIRSRSIRYLVDDVRWACHKVPGSDFDYPGEVILLLGTSDSVIRWRDPFPGCQSPDQLAVFLPAFEQANFPVSRRVEVCLVDDAAGANHITPEIDPVLFVRPGLSLLGQLA